MIIINDFFVRYKEAVSNQMELLLKEFGGKIISATRFMNQKAFEKEDRKDQIYVYPPLVYYFVAIKEIVIHPNEIIHIFEEEPCLWKRILLNMSKNKVFISMYRRPDEKYAKHIKKFHNLCKIFVELEAHKKILSQYGIEEDKIIVTPTPAKITRQFSTKEYKLSNINILFASWNNKEGDAITERGLRFLLELLRDNLSFTLTIPLRDNDIVSFVKIAEEYGVWNRISLVDINNNIDKLTELFENSNFVAFVPQKRIVKDVPNSLIDGLVRGKPAIISDIIDFSDVVLNEKIGIVFKRGEKAGKLDISEQKYKELSLNAYKYSEKHIPQNYVQIISNEYKQFLKERIDIIENSNN
ncbi:MAG: hypothetical protein IJ220_01335 [Clostridia bacterium]|nr:hypothetical protein [Clostridia bacterium]